MSGRNPTTDFSSPDGVRRGLVLGGGGVLGAAWIVGALCALEEVHGIDVRTCERIVGTSAGSVIAALLGAGVRPSEMRDHQLGLGVDAGPLRDVQWDYDEAPGSTRPQLPRLRPQNLTMVTRNVSRLHHMPPTAVLSAFVPEGRASLARVADLVDCVTPAGEWAAHPGVWVVTMDYDDGRRVVFGHPGSPSAALADAVRASCAIPGWYSPVAINGRRYIDGGACSATNADLLSDAGLDEVFVVAPMVSFAVDHPGAIATRLERRWRGHVTKRCLHECRKVHAGGAEVTVLGPGPEDLALMGGNMMNSKRRRKVLRTSLLTSKHSLLTPEVLDDLGSPAAEPGDAGFGAGTFADAG